MLSRWVPFLFAMATLVLYAVEPAYAHDKAEGTVVKVGEGKLTVSGANRENTYDVAKEAAVTLDGKPAKLEDIKEGFHVVVALGAKHVVTKIEAHSNAPVHPKHAKGETVGHNGKEHAKHDGHRSHGQKTGEHKGHKAGAHHGNQVVAEGKVKIGEKVPDFAVRTLDGKSVRLSELQRDGKRTKNGVVVLSFWCSTCHSCRDVEHVLAKLYKDYEGQAAVMALGANAEETTESVTAFLKEDRLELPIVLDPTGDTADLFGVNVTTTTVVIDGNGLLRYCGQFRHKDGGSAEEALKAVLAGKDVATKTTEHLGCPIMRK